MDKIHEVLDAYFKSWNEAFTSKNGDSIRSFMSKNFKGYWGHSNIDEPMQYDFNYDLNGVLEQYNNAHKSFVPDSISPRNDGKEWLIYGTETNMINGTQHPAKCMFVWRHENSEWKLLREYIELER